MLVLIKTSHSSNLSDVGIPLVNLSIPCETVVAILTFLVSEVVMVTAKVGHFALRIGCQAYISK